jgi:DNA/RNA-binding domain of Phe-tRNA-synthetase-like protein
MAHLDLSAVLPDFPDYRVALLVAEDLAIPAAPPAAVDTLVAETEAAARARWDGGTAGEIPPLQVWRAAYRRFGVKKTHYRCAAEKLLRLVQRDRGLPRINTLVDLYNALSLETLFPSGADDLDRVRPPLAFRYGRPGDSFVQLGNAEGSEDPPAEGEVVYADADKVLCRRWNWHQDARSAIRPDTRRAVITIQALEPDAAERLAAAAERLTGLIETHCGGRVRWSLADRDRPQVPL